MSWVLSDIAVIVDEFFIPLFKSKILISTIARAATVFTVVTFIRRFKIHFPMNTSNSFLVSLCCLLYFC